MKQPYAAFYCVLSVLSDSRFTLSLQSSVKKIDFELAFDELRFYASGRRDYKRKRDSLIQF